MKKIIIAGGTGFLGAALETYFTAQNYRVVILTRRPSADNHIEWNGKTCAAWTNELEGAEAVINLCGKSVDCRYTKTNKEAILASRINPTQLLNQAIEGCKEKPKSFINASSATIYVHSEEMQMTESEGIIGDDFSMNVVKKWEACFFQQHIESVRKIALRTSIVLGRKGGAFPKLMMITKCGLGGKQGTGNQMVSWISITDFCRAVDFIMSNNFLEGPINITAPQPVSNQSFMHKIRQHLKPLFHLHQPKFLLEIGALFLRTETELLLKSRNVIPERLLKSGFEFQHETVEDFLDSQKKVHNSEVSVVLL